MTVSHVSRELAIGESALWRWVQQARIEVNYFSLRSTLSLPKGEMYYWVRQY